jgi:hypothetical protein
MNFRYRFTVVVATVAAIATAGGLSVPSASASPTERIWCNVPLGTCMLTKSPTGSPVGTKAQGSNTTNFEAIDGVSFDGRDYVSYEQAGTSVCLELNDGDIITANCNDKTLAQDWYFSGSFPNEVSGELHSLYEDKTEGHSLGDDDCLIGDGTGTQEYMGVGACDANYDEWWPETKTA